tara:strand:- start:484 stop:822 length:339 start_codon:yes stop_codon:yes gene_type:complete
MGWIFCSFRDLWDVAVAVAEENSSVVVAFGTSHIPADIAVAAFPTDLISIDNQTLRLTIPCSFRIPDPALGSYILHCRTFYPLMSPTFSDNYWQFLPSNEPTILAACDFCNL